MRRLFGSHQELRLGETWITGATDLAGEPRPTLAVADGKILPQPKSEIPDRVIEADGAVLIPAFNDAHCHILPTGLDLGKLDLRPFSSPQDVLAALNERLGEVPSGRWLLAVGYDQTKFESQLHLTRSDLDQVSATVPILLRHVSGHASVANSAALAVAGVDETTPDPAGGSFERDGGHLTGVLLEHAHEMVTAASPKITYPEMVEGILRAARSMRALGILTAADMMTGRFNLAEELRAYDEASRHGDGIRFRLWVQWATVFGPRALVSTEFERLSEAMDPDRCRVAGIKIFADGAIGARTAAIYGQYEGSEGTEDEGQLIYEPNRLKEMVRIADAAGYPVAVHAIGDRAVDLVLEAFEQCPDPARHRLEHAMLLSDAQIARIAQVGCRVTMQPEFLMRFRHAYHAQLGPERAKKLKRMRSLIQAGLRLSLNSDRPIVAGDPIAGIEAAVSRGPDYDPSETLALDQAIDGYTRWAADANGDVDFGTLEAGQRADLLLLDPRLLRFS